MESRKVSDNGPSGSFCYVRNRFPCFAGPCHQVQRQFQIVNGEEISTPFCRNNALAAVARESGYRITDAEMRNNPSRKEEICRYLRSDIRVHPACDDVLPDGGGWR